MGQKKAPGATIPEGVQTCVEPFRRPGGPDPPDFSGALDPWLCVTAFRRVCPFDGCELFNFEANGISFALLVKHIRHFVKKN
jgi:hypothetical protein